MSALKTVERLVRRAYLAATDRPFSGTLVTSPEDALRLGATPRVLFLRQDRIGDVLVSVPVVRAVRHALPGAHLAMLFSRSNYGVRQALAPYLDLAWRYDKTPWRAPSLVRGLRRERYDVVVDLMDNPSTTARLASIGCQAPLRVGILHERPGHYTHAVPLLERERVHIVERIAQLLMPFGIDPARVPLELEYRLSEADRARARSRLPATDRPLRLMVNISGSSAARYWGAAKFIACLRSLAAWDPRFAIAVGGAPSYAEDIARIASEAGAFPLPATAAFHEYAALMREADLLLTPDTSVLHLGAAWQIPTVGLYHQPPGAPLPWYPYRTPSRTVLHPVAVREIPVGAVDEALRQLITERFGAPPARGAPA